MAERTTDRSYLTMTAPRSRWSFQLRTLFVVVTVLAVFCCWMASEIHITNARREMCIEIERNRGLVETASRPLDCWTATSWSYSFSTAGHPFRASDLDSEHWLAIQAGTATEHWAHRRMLGDQSVTAILLLKDRYGPAETKRIQRLFPESAIFKFTVGGGNMFRDKIERR